MSETRLGAIESIQHKLSVLCIGASEDVRAELADLIEDVGNLERNTLSAGLVAPVEPDAWGVLDACGHVSCVTQLRKEADEDAVMCDKNWPEDRPHRVVVLRRVEDAAPQDVPLVVPPTQYEYRTTTGGRKAWDGEPDLTKEGWELDPDRGRPGESWERFDYHEELYWRRPLRRAEGEAPCTCPCCIESRCVSCLSAPQSGTALADLEAARMCLEDGEPAKGAILTRIDALRSGTALRDER